ncbi:MAG TPA: hypothetical protein VIM35_05030 [Gallionella sp.]
MVPRFVKPYVKMDKSDMADAEAELRFVAMKSVEQQAILPVRRLRE